MWCVLRLSSGYVAGKEFSLGSTGRSRTPRAVCVGQFLSHQTPDFVSSLCSHYGLPKASVSFPSPDSSWVDECVDHQVSSQRRWSHLPSQVPARLSPTYSPRSTWPVALQPADSGWQPPRRPLACASGWLRSERFPPLPV